MKTTHKIKLDFNLQDTIPRIRAVQGDQYSRVVEISLHSNTVPWTIPEKATVLIRYRKPNRTIGIYDTLPNGEPAFHLNDNMISITIAPDLLRVPGDVSIIVSLICGEQILSTFEMVLEVQANLNTGNSEPGASAYISGLLPSPRDAQEGQILAVEKIDSHGTVLATSAIDLPPNNAIQSISQDTEASTKLETVYNVNLSDGTQHSFIVKNGADGQDGKSAYDYAKDAGYTGTEDAFSARLIKGYPNTSVTEYGAKGDGSTNDTAAFQNALANNRVVFVPGGTYKLSGGLVIRPNCCLELSQDTVLEFSNTSGNCIEMRSSATLRGNHAVLRVPYAFNGHVIDVNTVDDTTKDTPPFAHWDPQWKRGRYIYDVCIVKPDPTYGLNYSVDGNCYGTAIYLGCESENTEVGFIWGAMLQGIRIAGGFTYGIHILNHDDPNDGAEDDAWNHDMRIEAVIQGCETGVSMTNCNGAHLAVTIQPCKYESGPKYAKWGVYLNDCRYVDMIGSRVWDWNEKYTLWTSGGQYQHIALFGNCSGLLLDDFLCSEHSEDIRNLIYTDTESNFDTMSVLQEAGGRNFKSIDGDPYFNNGNKDLRITTEAELSEYFQTDRVLNFTNVLETAIDKNGNVYGTKSGYYDSQFNTLDDDGYHVHTGFIPCKKGDTFYTDGIKLRDDGCVRITLFDSSFNYVKHVNGGNMMKTGYYVTYAETDNGFALTLNSANDAEINKFAYARFNFHNGDLGKHPMMSVNEEIKYTVEGFLADGVKVKAKNIVGLNGDGSSSACSWNNLTDKPFGESEHAVLLPPTQFVGGLMDGALVALGVTVDLVEGKTYTVNWNGVDYETECFIGASMIDGTPMPMLGNPVILGGENNNLPFGIGGDETGIAAIPLDGSTAVTVGINGYGVVPIATKYVANALPYYIGVIDSGNSTYITTEKVSHVMAMYDSGRDIKVKVNTSDNGYLFTMLFNLLFIGDTASGKMLIFTALSLGGATFLIFHCQEDDTFIVDQNI